MTLTSDTICFPFFLLPLSCLFSVTIATPLHLVLEHQPEVVSMQLGPVVASFRTSWSGRGVSITVGTPAIYSPHLLHLQ